MLGDVGGVLEVFIIAFSFVLNPIAEHSFIIKAASKLFRARTFSENIFYPTNDFKKDKFLNSGLLSN